VDKRYILIFDMEKEKIVDEKILPEFKGKMLLSYNFENLNLNDLIMNLDKEKDILILYLNENQLLEILPNFLEKDLTIGFLPHEKSMIFLESFGVIDNDLTKNLKNIFKNVEEENKYSINVLHCNEIPVFKYVKIGEMFMYNDLVEGKNIFHKIKWLKEKLSILRKTPHNPYAFFINDKKIIDTSALGITIVTDPNFSITAKRVAIDDDPSGFHTIISAPKSILEMLRFLIKSFFIRKKLNKIPDFLGYIKNNNLKIKSSKPKSSKPFNYSLDNKNLSALEIELYLKQNQFWLIPGEKFNQEYNKVTTKSVQKIQNLPNGEEKEEFILNHIPFIKRATHEQFKDLFLILRENAELTEEFMVMLILATLIATFGLFANSTPVIIGAMILAPLMGPIISVAMGIVQQDFKLIKKSANTIFWGTMGALGFGLILTFLIPLKKITPEIQARMTPNLLDLMVAITSGVAAAYANSKEKIAKSLAGVAIAVALVPPLASAGIGIGWWKLGIFSGAFLLYLTNLAGIILAAGITFILLGFAPFHRAKKGLLYIFYIVLLISIPLSVSFYHVFLETQLTKKIESLKIDGVKITPIKIIPLKEPYISVKITSAKNLSEKDIDKLKMLLEEELDKKIKLEITTTIEK
jgi:uncharacterized hydrophobic protein (TIGR00271 family)